MIRRPMIKRNTLIFTSSAAVALLALTACGDSPEKSEEEAATTTEVETETQTVAYETLNQKVSYGIGLQMGGQLARDPSVSEIIEFSALEAGIKAALEGSEPAVSQTELMAAFQELQQQAEETAKAAATENKEAGEAFLAQNAERSEVQTTESGLQYEVIESSGSGVKPSAADKVRVHYHGTLLDGTVFDSSVNRGTPAEFPVTGVIPGWVEALQLMDTGDKWKLYIPSDLAYGDNGSGRIAPGATLVFEVEVLEIL